LLNTLSFLLPLLCSPQKTDAYKLAPIGVVMLFEAQILQHSKSIWTESGT